MQAYQEYRFKEQLDAAMKSIRRILDTTRNPEQPSDVQHVYDDKYTLVEFMTNMALAAESFVLEELGVTPAILKTLREWAKTKAVTMRFSAEQRCVFSREVTKEVDSATKTVVQTSAFGNFSSKTVTTVHEFYWKFDADWEISVYTGTNANEKIVLKSRKGTYEIMTGSKDTPRKIVHVEEPVEVPLNWYLNQLDTEGRFNFRINRSVKTCHTPRRNQDVDALLPAFANFYNFNARMRSYFINNLFPVQTGHGLDLAALNAESVFIPVVPLFEKAGEKRIELKEEKGSFSNAPAGTVSLSVGDAMAFLQEERNSLKQKFDALGSTFPPNQNLITVLEAQLVVLTMHAQKIAQYHVDLVEYVENMLRKQLIAAIGKEVGPSDFAEYMRFHQRKLFKPEYQPKGFCYAVRRPQHYPEGTLSIEAKDSSAMAQPIDTAVNSSTATHPMFFYINAATKIDFMGDRHLHCAVLHSFSGESGREMNLVARARQFSSFILLIGTIQTGGEFKPTYGTIVQNKDELVIPLLLETLPTPKEFADAIESLSPEQQRFCKAFRSMQLASTLFGVCIIQIKPQLEKLLGLPDDSLTKEIRLTQDLMEMFIKYQIPSDLISYDGNPNASVQDKLARVKTHVKAMQEMIQHSKDTELKESAMEFTKQVLAPVPVQSVSYSSYDRSASPPMPTSRSRGMIPSAARSMALAPMAMSQPMPMPPPPPMAMSAPAPAPVVTAPVTAPISSPATPATPSPATPPTTQDRKEEATTAMDTSADDYTTLPNKLDSSIAKMDEDNALRSTIIKVAPNWTKSYQKGLLSKPASMAMREKEQKDDKNAAFDLLDALSRSGVLSVDQASLHVILVATHCFDKTLVETVVQENLNPIEKVERSVLIMASTIFGVPPATLVQASELARVQTYAPTLFLK